MQPLLSFKHKPASTYEPNGEWLRHWGLSDMPLSQHSTDYPHAAALLRGSALPLPGHSAQRRHACQITCSYQEPLVFTLKFLFGRISNSGHSNGKGHRSKCIPRPRSRVFLPWLPTQLPRPVQQPAQDQQTLGQGHIRTLFPVPKYTDGDGCRHSIQH